MERTQTRGVRQQSRARLAYEARLLSLAALGDDLVLHVLGCLGSEALCTAARVCTQWQRLGRSRELWLALCRSDFGAGAWLESVADCAKLYARLANPKIAKFKMPTAEDVAALTLIVRLLVCDAEDNEERLAISLPFASATISDEMIHWEVPALREEGASWARDEDPTDLQVEQVSIFRATDEKVSTPFQGWSYSNNTLDVHVGITWASWIDCAQNVEHFSRLSNIGCKAVLIPFCVVHRSVC